MSDVVNASSPAATKTRSATSPNPTLYPALEDYSVISMHEAAEGIGQQGVVPAPEDVQTLLPQVGT